MSVNISKLTINYYKFAKIMEESIILEELVIMHVLQHWSTHAIADNYHYIFNTHNILVRKIISVIDTQNSSYNIISDPIFLSSDKLTISRILSSEKTSCNILHAIERLKEIAYAMFMYNYLKDLDKLIDSKHNVNKIYVQSKIRCMIQEFNDKFNEVEEDTVFDSNNVDDYVDKMLFNDNDSVIPSGIAKLDERIMGIRCCDLTVIAARPGAGKTTFCVNMILKYCLPDTDANNVDDNKISNKKNILYVSPDMNIKYVYEKLICGYKKITRQQLLEAKDTEEVKKILKSIPLILTDTHIFEDICSILERNRKNLAAIIIDYIQLIYNEVTLSSSRQEQIGKMIMKLKSICRRNQIAIILISQMNRECEKRRDNSFLLSDIRDSGYLEQEADLVIFLDKVSKSQEGGLHKISDMLKVVIGKNRHGSLFDLSVYIDYEFSSIH